MNRIIIDKAKSKVFEAIIFSFIEKKFLNFEL
jgi:hypothetical protein